MKRELTIWITYEDDEDRDAFVSACFFIENCIPHIQGLRHGETVDGVSYEWEAKNVEEKPEDRIWIRGGR